MYKEIPGWKQDLTAIRDYDALPQAFKDYVSYIERETGCRIHIISIGPDRDAIITR